MAIYTNKVFPAGGEAGHGGGIIQVKSAVRTGSFSFSPNSYTTYKNIITADITPSDSSNKILIFGNVNGVASRNSTNHSGEWEGHIAYNPNNTNSGGDVTSFTNLGMLTGLGVWGGYGEASIGDLGFHTIHEPNTTSQCVYSLIANRRSTSWFNEEYGSDKGTTLILMEVSS